jgi:predicted aconitase
MYLSEEEQKMLDGAYGETTQKMHESCWSLSGIIYGAEHMIEINNAHPPGVLSCGGRCRLSYVRDASHEACSESRPTLNTSAWNYMTWKELWFPEEFAAKQMELSQAYEKNGCVFNQYMYPPYLNGNVPMFGEHVAWGESSANRICKFGAGRHAQTAKAAPPLWPPPSLAGFGLWAASG